MGSLVGILASDTGGEEGAAGGNDNMTDESIGGNVGYMESEGRLK